MKVSGFHGGRPPSPTKKPHNYKPPTAGVSETTPPKAGVVYNKDPKTHKA